MAASQKTSSVKGSYNVDTPTVWIPIQFFLLTSEGNPPQFPDIDLVVEEIQLMPYFLLASGSNYLLVFVVFISIYSSRRLGQCPPKFQWIIIACKMFKNFEHLMLISLIIKLISTFNVNYDELKTVLSKFEVKSSCNFAERCALRCAFKIRQWIEKIGKIGNSLEERLRDQLIGMNSS